MNPNITKIIDQYLNNELSPEDKLAFEERLKSNRNLQEEVEMQRSIQQAAKRAYTRTAIKKTGRNYHAGKILKWAGFSLSIIIVALTATYFLSGGITDFSSESNISNELIEKLDQEAGIDRLETQYFDIPKDGSVEMSEGGVLLSVPENAFILNGQPYSGDVVLQYQEALDAADIVKSGLSTMSGDRLLETGGMFSVQGFTADGEALAFNPEVGVYVQVPTDELKKDMMLFDGVKQADGSIDWQNPEELEKIPVPISMSKLNFYPKDYEPYLDEIKWKRSKEKRDSLYLSFERQIRIIQWLGDTEEPDTSWLVPAYSYPQEANFIDSMVYDVHEVPAFETDVLPRFISPSNVLGFWNKKFNKTILATHEFERRMQAVHNTCDNTVLDKYVNGLNRSMSSIDREVVEMGYPEFEAYAAENVGKLNPNNPHLKNLKQFYEQGVEALKKRAKYAQDKEAKRQKKWDDKVGEERQSEQNRKADRENTNLQEEFSFNLDNVYKQLGYTRGFTVIGRGGTISPGPIIKNIDQYVCEATVKRESTTITDPKTGKKAQITYNDFTIDVSNPEQYEMLYMYLFPHQLNSYQRINPSNGKFDYRLNGDIIYDVAVIGINENGYHYFQKQTLNSGNLGTVTLEQISERKFEASLAQLNKKRIGKPMRIKEELDWLLTERENYKEQELRESMNVFRTKLANRISGCLFKVNYDTGQELSFGIE